jgi:quercetin dioxygenase-like cupin family protein
VIRAGVVFAAAVLLAGAGQALAADPPAPVRTVLQQFPASGAPNVQIIVASAVFAPGARLAFHTHPGEETGVVVSGLLKIERQGLPTLMLKPGDSYLIPRGVAHQPSAPEGETHVVATFVVDKDKPLSEAKP